MGGMTWRRARATASVALGTLLLPVSGLICACNSPTLPVPPPGPDKLALPSEVELQPGGKSVRIASDGASPLATVDVFMFNMELLEGIQAAKDSFGHYEGFVPVELSCMRPTNHVELWQRKPDENGPGFLESPHTLVTVPRDAPPPVDAATCDEASVDADSESGSGVDGGGD
jgi:hypothetical protein